MEGIPRQVSQRPAKRRRATSDPRHASVDCPRPRGPRALRRSPSVLARVRLAEPTRRPRPRGLVQSRRVVREPEEIRPGRRRLGTAFEPISHKRTRRPRSVSNRLDRGRGDGRPRKSDRTLQADRDRPLANASARKSRGDGVAQPDRQHPARLPIGRNGSSRSRDPQPRKAHVFRVQAQCRVVFPEEAVARECRVA